MDIDLRFLTDMPENVEVRALDIREDEVEAEAFDLVHCRALLMHLPDQAETLTKLAAALRPEGLLLAEEPDFGLFHYGGHPDSLEMSEIAHRTFAHDERSGNLQRPVRTQLAGAALRVWAYAARYQNRNPGQRSRRARLRACANDGT